MRRVLAASGGVTMTVLLVLLGLAGCSQQAAPIQPLTQAPVALSPVLPDNAVVSNPPAPIAAAPVVTAMPAVNANTAGARLSSLLRDIRLQVGDAAASSVQQCRKVALGAKPCGGPASYLVYSTAQTDEQALLKKVNQYNKMSQSYNREQGMMSDCAMVPEPAVVLVDGVCKAGSAGDLY